MTETRGESTENENEGVYLAVFILNHWFLMTTFEYKERTINLRTETNFKR